MDNPIEANAYNNFIECLEFATGNISCQYMLLPVAGADLPIYRERVYCYELYHQLRSVWNNLDNYSLGGEVDKANHMVMKGLDISDTKPDLLVHKPGNMDGNLVIVELKPVFGRFQGIRKDLRTLTAFTGTIGKYQHGIYLVYGEDKKAFIRFLRKIKKAKDEDVDGRIKLNKIQLYWHHSIGGPAEYQELNL